MIRSTKFLAQNLVLTQPIKKIYLEQFWREMGRLAQTRSLCLKSNPSTSFKLLFICFHFAKKLTSSSIHNKIQWWTILHKFVLLLYLDLIHNLGSIWLIHKLNMGRAPIHDFQCHSQTSPALAFTSTHQTKLGFCSCQITLTTSSQKRPINNTYSFFYYPFHR